MSITKEKIDSIPQTLERRKSFQLQSLQSVPQSKNLRFSTRLNSDYKWNEKGVVGALAVPSEPHLNFKTSLEKKSVEIYKDRFDAYLEIWHHLKLRRGFVQACEGVPKQTSCCGLIPDDDKTIMKIAKTMNKHWAKTINAQLIEEGFKVDVFVWCWNNASGKAETNVLLIRFFDLAAGEKKTTKAFVGLSPLIPLEVGSL
jgi:hypothetical protein